MRSTGREHDLLRRHEELSSGRLPVMEGKDEVEQIHLARYTFAAQYIRGYRVLDCATGIGYGAHRLATEGAAAAVTGVDISAEALRTAKGRYPQANLAFLLITPGRLPFDDESFDAIVSFETVEHTADPLFFLRELRRVLKPGGPLIISTPNKRFHSFGRRTPWNPHHAREFYPGEFLKLLRDHFARPEFWGGQEFLPITPRTIARNNWTEFRYYKLLHRPAYSGAMSIGRGLRAAIHHLPPAAFSPGEAIGKRSLDRTTIVRWEDGREPYTIIAVCRKSSTEG